jgi:hypothetical protein
VAALIRPAVWPPPAPPGTQHPGRQITGQAATQLGAVERGRPALAEGLPAVYLEVWTDTHHFALAQVEEFVREMEAIVVKAISWRFS